VPRRFDRTVRALTDAMIRQRQATPERCETVERVSGFLLMTHAKMPDYLRMAFRILTLLFDASSYPFKGKPFHRLGLAERIAQIKAWESSRLQFRRALMTYYRTMAVFGLYSELYGQDYEWSGGHEQG
jgi:hypothetical protein